MHKLAFFDVFVKHNHKQRTVMKTNAGVRCDTFERINVLISYVVSERQEVSFECSSTFTNKYIRTGRHLSIPGLFEF